MNTTHLQSDYTGNTEADDNIVKTTQDIVSGATIDSSKYTYQDAQNSANYIIFDTDARTLEDTVTLDSDFTSGSITLKADSTAEGTKESTFNGEMYQFTYQESEDSQEYRYKLSADGTKLINIDLSEEVTTPVNGLDTLFAAAKHAYTTDKVAVDAAIADLIIDQDTENTNHGKAAEAITKDTATIASLDVDWGTYQAAAGLLKDAQDAQAAAKQVFADDSAAYTTANGIYTAPITDTIDTRANDAIVASLEEGGAINEAVTQGVTAVYNQAHEWAETVTGLEDDGTGAANQLRKALTKLETEDEITNTIESKNFAGALPITSSNSSTVVLRIDITSWS